MDDLVEGLILLMDSDYPMPVNLGNQEEFTMLELADKIIEMTGSKSKKEFLPLPEDDPLQRNPDISLAKKLLKWQPKTKFDEGLEKTISWFRESQN